MKKILFITSVLCLFTAYRIIAQDIPEFEKHSFVDSLSGKVYWNKSIPFGIKVFSPNSGSEVTLTNKQTDLIYFDTEGLNTIRSPWLVDPKTKNYVSPKVDVQFEIYADGIAPITTLTLSKSSSYSKNGTVFYGKNLKILLSAKDAMSGVNQLLCSVNNSKYSKFTDTLEIQQEGKLLVNYFSVDNVGNVEKMKSQEFTIDSTAPKTYHTITGIDLKNNIISSSTKMTLYAEDNIVGVKRTYYAIDESNYKVYQGGLLPIKQLPNGNHVISYYSIDNVMNIEKKTELKFYLDKQSPILSSDILGDRYVVNHQIYFSGRTKLKLTAFDNKSGVKNIMYSINNGPYKEYSDPFYLPSREGLHKIEYYATDNTGNFTGSEENSEIKTEEFQHKVVRKIFTDLVGPSINHKFSGCYFPTRDTVFIGPQTLIHLSAVDEASGLQYISYSIDKNLEEVKYDKPFSINKNGLHKVELFAYDNVNNRNKRSFLCFVDNKPPLIYMTFSIQPIARKTLQRADSTSSSYELDVYPNYVSIYLAAKDITVGTKRISYSLNGGRIVPYLEPIHGFLENQKNILKVISYDNLENKGEKEFEFFIGNK